MRQPESGCGGADRHQRLAERDDDEQRVALGEVTGLITHSPDAPRIAPTTLTSAATIHSAARTPSWANPPATTNSGAIDANEPKSMNALRVAGIVPRLGALHAEHQQLHGHVGDAEPIRIAPAPCARGTQLGIETAMVSVAGIVHSTSTRVAGRC